MKDYRREKMKDYLYSKTGAVLDPSAAAINKVVCPYACGRFGDLVQIELSILKRYKLKKKTRTGQDKK
jgi:hypothetical protein